MVIYKIFQAEVNYKIKNQKRDSEIQALKRLLDQSYNKIIAIRSSLKQMDHRIRLLDPSYAGIANRLILKSHRFSSNWELNSCSSKELSSFKKSLNKLIFFV
jgi:hypothetical protein